MANQYYFRQKVNVKQGRDIIKGSITDYNEQRKEYLVRTTNGISYFFPENKIEPDYSNADAYNNRGYN